MTTAHPLATKAAHEILAAGGAPIDAAIAAQMVLGLVEAQSSGIGGGALLLHWDAKRAELTSYDGLAAAPANVTASLATDVDGTPLKSEDVARGGRSVGVPGTVAVLHAVHTRYGKLPWAALFNPAIALAEAGYPLAPYMHRILSLPDAARNHAEMRGLFFDASGKLLPIGAMIKNPAYARVLKRIATVGPAGQWADEALAAMRATLARGLRASLMTEQDLKTYRPEVRDPACAPFLVYTVCVMAPPSFGGVVVLQVLQMLETRGLRDYDFDDPEFVHLFAEAGKLAQADRLHYVGDPSHVRVPTGALVSAEYARTRGAEIDRSRAAREPVAGQVEKKVAILTPDPAPGSASDRAAEFASDTADATSQLAIVDRDGNALSMTTTINLNFGARLLHEGYVLNNALTNFSAAPRAGQAAPNRMAAGKRPVTSMAPTIVFDKGGKPIIVGGSAGGGQIVDYIAQSLVDMLANGRSPSEALARGHVSTAIRGKVQLEANSAAARLALPLQAKGHSVEIVPMPSGLGFLKHSVNGWAGAADPRRDGVAEIRP